MIYDENGSLMICDIDGLERHSGKVRDVFDLGDKILMVVTDRISAFDVKLPNGIPMKGKVLNQLSLFWMNYFTKDIPNHLITADVNKYPDELKPYADVLRGRSMLVKKIKMYPCECIARGYITGSAWKEYQKYGTVNNEVIKAGYMNASKLDNVMFTPTTKADVGHDEAIDMAQLEILLGSANVAEELRSSTISLYEKAANYARERGIIIADTKFEFGVNSDNQITLADEILTPDSSRFWPVESYEVGKNPPSLDKQFVRDYLASINFTGSTENIPTLPEEVIKKTTDIYVKAFKDLTGNDPE